MLDGVAVGVGASQQRRQDVLGLHRREPHDLQVLAVRKLDVERAGGLDPGGHDGALRVDEQPVHVENCGGEHGCILMKKKKGPTGPF